ncbi:MAG: site-2 protease family protein [Patescibacteria group bacterium]
MIYVFQVIVLIFSAVIHEYMHGWMADRLGDPTAKNLGRLTLNPLKHLDWFGSFLLPLVMIISHMPFVFGWAKPVPYNPHNLRDRKWGEAKVAGAGALGNLIVAVFFALVFRLMPFYSLTFNGLIAAIIYINLVLAIFNLVPIPPLDGSKILAAFLSPKWEEKYLSLEKYGFIFVILFVMLGFNLIMPLVNFLFKLIAGYSF